ncbi:DUF2141 domain-containing protein [Thalassotalea sp. 1_MG-2023]|uniref:DUF2141 domain-containing protein n=1 Tax=Thalassotalea sp. 1_MG-2023 TaxID=3062680 RepID=UPI0026E19511|nr:DUF2141 domain-containing protein [Thalassotalea sp. 1_MG-2023]MDO6428576.1 DUF2141 domain-containing protein [Thalassotalea sp. 1_MG-2023]
MNIKPILYTTLLTVAPMKINAKDIAINVSNIDVSRRGNLIVMIFNENGFPKKHDQALASQTTLVTDNVHTFTFNITEKDFAIKVLHDENQDGKVSKNWTGVYPKEGLGFSNNQKIGFTGPPVYKKSKLSLHQASSNISIAIIYP